MTWTAARVEKLKALDAEGMSAREIAQALGGGVTRNAVIGKRHRLGLSDASKQTEAGRRARGVEAPERARGRAEGK